MDTHVHAAPAGKARWRLMQTAAAITATSAIVVAWAAQAAAQAVQPTAAAPPGSLGPGVDQILSWIAWALLPAGVAGVLVVAITMIFEIGDAQTRATWGRKLGKVFGGIAIGGSAAALVNIFA